MRIVGGTLKGRRLAVPDDTRVRPTSDRTREAVFNILAHGVDGFTVEGVRVLDLFAGTGAQGLEALSRGAGFCVFVDDHAASRALIRRNVEDLGLTGQCRIFRRDATRLGPSAQHGAFGLVFADPPYGKGLGERAIASALSGGWLADGAVVVLEEAAVSDITLPDGFRLLDERRYGDTVIRIARLA